ncbi:hypothetical protein [Rubrivivax gelatinosus]|uniref:hypothetical protein n=1 Tax=Rubrivivax gelatinosus TaxID=28068 RepID=UPI0005C23FBA|nr:hypothetical protein [Rubrivivax gelatinosus]MBG6083150.1 hypothetical protein [Rubrivivax gelatinosus]
MSKASQRRLAEARKRSQEIRGSALNRLRRLAANEELSSSGSPFWRECVKHLPADPVTPSTDGLCRAIDRARIMIDAVAKDWQKLVRDEEPNGGDWCLPGVLLEAEDMSDPRFAFSPMCVAMRLVSAHSRPAELVIERLDLLSELGLWVFGGMLTLRGETVVLAAHRDGTRTAAVRDHHGEWTDAVPSLIVAPAGVAAMEYQLAGDELGAGISGLKVLVNKFKALGLPDKEAVRFVRMAADQVQTPYLKMAWMAGIGQVVANKTVETIGEDAEGMYKDIVRLDREHRRARGGLQETRAQLEMALERERSLNAALHEARSRRPLHDSPATTPAQRLAGIF